MGVASGCSVRRYIDFFILLFPTLLVSVLLPTFSSFKKMCYIYIYTAEGAKYKMASISNA